MRLSAVKIVFFVLFVATLFLIAGCQDEIGMTEEEKEIIGLEEGALVGKAVEGCPAGCNCFQIAGECIEREDGTMVNGRLIRDRCYVNTLIQWSCLEGDYPRDYAIYCRDICEHGCDRVQRVCIEPIEGCTDPTAINYNEEAEVDDGSCEYAPIDIEGCTDPDALNYNPGATVDDGSCEFPVEECVADSILIELQWPQRLSQVKPLLTSEDLPELLQDNSVTNERGTSPYTQQFSFSNEDSEYILGGGFIISRDDQIAKYHLVFEEPFTSEIVGDNLEDYDDVSIEMLGEEYEIVIAERVSGVLDGSVKLVLIKDPIRDTLLEGQTRTYIWAENPYTITVTFMDEDEAKFIVNGESTNKLQRGESVTFSDGTLIGVSEILFSEETHSVTFFLGAEEIELRDDDVTDAISSRNVIVDSEWVDGAEVITIGNDDGSVFSIDSIEINMVAAGNYHVDVGNVLSEEIDFRTGEEEVLFTQNWDIRLNEYNEEPAGGIIEIMRLCPTESPSTTDNIPPTITISCNPHRVMGGETVTCTCEATDSQSGVSSVGFAGGETSESITSGRPGTGSTSTCTAVDNAGNTVTATGIYIVQRDGISFDKEIWASITHTPDAVFEVEEDTIAVTEINFDVSERTYGAWIQIYRLGSLPISIAEFTREVYQYFDITSRNVDDVATNINIDFKIEKSWLTENGFANDDVALFRYNGGLWDELPPTEESEDDIYVYYTTTSPGFSYFVIGER